MAIPKEKRRYTSILGLVLAFVVVLSPLARAELFTFLNYTNTQNLPGNQLSVDVEQVGGQVQFTFYNNYNPDLSAPIYIPPTYGVLTDIYFADGALFQAGSGVVVGDSGETVAFTGDLIPGNLPAGLEGPYTAFFESDADNPSPHWGLKSYAYATPPVGPAPVPLEYVTIGLDLVTGATLADVLSALADGSFLIAVHVQTIGGVSGASDWFVTPVPGAAILGLLGLGIAGWKLRRFGS